MDTKMGVHFWDSAAQQVFGDRRGWSVEMFYISDPNSSQDVLARIGPEAVRLCEIQKHHEVILRVDWAPGQNIPPRAGGEALATATKEQFGRLVRQLLSEIATVCIEKNTHPIRAVIVGNESNLKGAPASEGGSEVHGECDQDPTSCDPIWYADVYKAVVQQLFPEDGAPIDDALILVAGMSPAAGASPVHSHGSSDFYLQVFERLASTEGSPKRPDGVAFHAYGNAGVNETGLESFVADVQMHRPVFEAVEPSTPFFITEMNTKPNAPSIQPEQVDYAGFIAESTRWLADISGSGLAAGHDAAAVSPELASAETEGTAEETAPTPAPAGELLIPNLAATVWFPWNDGGNPTAWTRYQFRHREGANAAFLAAATSPELAMPDMSNGAAAAYEAEDAEGGDSYDDDYDFYNDEQFAYDYGDDDRSYQLDDTSSYNSQYVGSAQYGTDRSSFNYSDPIEGPTSFTGCQPNGSAEEGQ